MRIILTGATGMVGEGVLLACLDHPQIDEVLSLSRKPCGHAHTKLKELIVPDFLQLTELPQGYDACFYCAGVSSVGMTEADYTRVTYDTPVKVASLLVSPQLTFVHVSGAGTDGSEKGSVMWARVKGQAENELARMGFQGVYNFRPGMMKPMPGQRYVNRYYKYVAWLYPLFRAGGRASTLREVAEAMIVVSTRGDAPHVLEVRDINRVGALPKPG